MRIQNNLMTQNTHRFYANNTNKVSKYAEKIASGRAINRAADNAAGLAIAEKLLSQITGTNMATRNSQDAISLVQTAEGGLQGTQDILQRMEELAVQAANGINQGEDRTALNAEFEQLKREINDVAQGTTFNNMPVLDGSMSQQGYQRSAQTSGINLWRTENPGSIARSGPTINSDVTRGSETSTLSIGDVSKIQNGDTLQVGNRTLTVQSGGTGADEINWDAASGNFSDFVSAVGNALGDGYWVNDTSANGTNSFTIEGARGTTETTVNAADAAAGASAQDPTANTDTGMFSRVNLADSDVKAGLRLTANGQTYTVTDANNPAKQGEIALDSTQVNSVQTLASAINNNDNEVVASANGNGLTMAMNTAGNQTADLRDTAVSKAGAQNATVNTPAGAIPRYTYRFEFDTSKMKDGDQFSVRIDGQERTFQYDASKYKNMGNSTGSQQIAKDIAASFGMDNVSATGSALTIRTNSEDVSATLPKNGDATVINAKSWPTDALRIQVGAEENQQLGVGINSMNTAGLGLDNISLSSQNEAGRAITAVRNAINMVSDQRATLGATQNRLDHKIQNLRVAAENQTAAESRIRDADIAEEMSNLVKSSILQRASTAMLAHGNGIAQSALSLLRG